jgi:hypothetical protein
MAWDDTDNEEYDDDDFEEEEDLEEDEGRPAITRDLYGGNIPDPFELPELEFISFADFLSKYQTSATSTDIKYYLNQDGVLQPVNDEKPKKSKSKDPLIFDPENIVSEYEVKKRDRTKKVR